MFDLHNIAPNPLAVPVSADPWPMVFRVRKGQLRDAFRIVEPCAGKQLLLRLGPESVTLRSERMAKGVKSIDAPIMWCEARVPLMEPVPVPVETILDLALDTDLFSGFLCRYDLHDVSAADRKNAPDDHFVVRVSRTDDTPSGPGPIYLKVSDTNFSTRRTGRFVGVSFDAPRTMEGVSVVPATLAAALRDVLAFTRRSKDDPKSFGVTVDDGQVRLERQGLQRVVDLAELGGVKLRLTSEGAGPLAETLARFRGETRLCTAPDSYSFLSEAADCGVASHPRAVPPLPEIAHLEAGEWLTIEEGRFLEALHGILDQPERTPSTLRLCVEGGRTGTLRLPVPVDAGEAAILCPVVRERCAENGEAHPLYSALVKTQFLRLLTHLPNARPTELLFFEKHLLITQARDGCTVRTIVARGERRRP